MHRLGRERRPLEIVRLFACPSISDLALVALQPSRLDDDLSCHMRVKTTEIADRTNVREHHGDLLIRVERSGVKLSGCVNDRVRDIVAILPGDGRPRLYRQLGRT